MVEPFLPPKLVFLTLQQILMMNLEVLKHAKTKFMITQSVLESYLTALKTPIKCKQFKKVKSL